MNSTHPFYPILIPNTSYVKDLVPTLVVQGGGSRTVVTTQAFCELISVRV